MTKPATCGGCLYWRRLDTLADGTEAGQCVRYPPTPVDDGSSPIAMTMNTHWCGEHQPNDGTIRSAWRKVGKAIFSR